eukprot:g78689.t1
MLSRGSRILLPRLVAARGSVSSLRCLTSSTVGLSKLDVIRDYLSCWGNIAQGKLEDPMKYCHPDMNIRFVVHCPDSVVPGTKLNFDFDAWKQKAFDMKKNYKMSKGTIHNLQETTKGEVVAEFELEAETHSGYKYHGTYALFFELKDDKIYKSRQYIDTQARMRRIQKVKVHPEEPEINDQQVAATHLASARHAIGAE